MRHSIIQLRSRGAGCRGTLRACVSLCATLLSAALVAVSSQAVAQDIVRFPAKGQVPPGYPSQYASVIAAAEQEGQIVIHSTTDLGVATPLIDDFQALYPRIEVRYQDMNSNDLYNVYLSDLLASPSTADVLWSSAMDLQFRLANNGQAQEYDSPESNRLPPWAMWKNTAFGTTFEPIVFVYNKRLLAAAEIPQTHADLARLLTERRERFAGKVATYDIERSALGFLLATEDERSSGDYLSLIKALGSASAHLEPTTEAVIRRVSKGEALIGYNALGSYAYTQGKKDATIGYVQPRDYTLVVTRVMLIGKKAANPNAARLWVDYLLSRRGQEVLANRVDLGSLRADVEATNAAALETKALGQSVRPIALSPDLLSTSADRTRRSAFLRQWQQAIGVKP